MSLSIRGCSGGGSGNHAVKGWPDPIPVYGLIALRAYES
ncbi:hypothetical protein SynA1562_02669 [Synechococcus sp. A15-62]|nr:hypothetical protein SynA1562_02669 [Synechococcus sp. A15-62]